MTSAFLKGSANLVSVVPSHTADAGHGSETSSLQAGMKIINDFRQTVTQDLSLINVASLPAVIDAIRHHGAIDDRKFLLEHIITFLSKLPDGPLSASLQTKVIKLFYNDLPHPPATHVGARYAYRSADGGGNNVHAPDMGKAGTPYARSVPQAHPLAAQEMPDAGLVFDTLLRRDKFVAHPAGLSSLMFAFAALVTHTVFRTSHTDTSINETSSYVDLAPLYGACEAEQSKVRVRDGRGLLHPDAFAEARLLLLPPAVCALLVLFNRNHNYIVRKLLAINERGTYADPDALSAEQRKEQDEDLFQTARLVNCGWFASIIFSDYFSAILGLVRQGNSWSLSPFGEIRNEDHTLFERGRGNVCSVEFNCLYRWHATTSQHDERWVEQTMARMFGGRDPETVSPADLKNAMRQMHAAQPDATQWTFGDMQRQTKGLYKGSFRDEDLAEILMSATEQPAAAFKARGTPGCMRLVEVMGIEAARRWGCCSLNDFRRFIGLKPYTSFLEWNPDKDIASAAEKLYGDIENLELYAGLQAEDSKPVMDGAGLCPSFTLSRAILADAIALTRGDRFFTADYTPHNLTAWGFADCARDATAPGCGSTLGRLLLRTLPRDYAADSAYTWFPLMTPRAMEGILRDLGQSGVYGMERPGRVEDVGEVVGYHDAAQVLGGGAFVPVTVGRAAEVVKGKGFFIASSDPLSARRYREAVRQLLTASPRSEEKIMEFFYNKTRELVIRESWSVSQRPTKNVDVVRDVLKYVPIHWASEVTGIRLGDVDADGSFTPKKLFGMLAEIYEFFFLDFEQAKYTRLLQAARNHVGVLLKHIKAAHSSGTLSSLASAFAGIFVGHTDSWHARFALLGFDEATLANVLLAVLVGCSVELSQALVNVVNFYFDLRGAVPGEPNVASGHETPPNEKAEENAEDLHGIALEALRLDPPFAGVYRTALAAQTVGGLSVPAGGTVFVDIATANRDADVFPKPPSAKTGRADEDPFLAASGAAACLGLDLTARIAAQVLRAVLSFRNVRRAPGQSGVLGRHRSDTAKTSTWMYLDHAHQESPWATSMVLQYDV